MDDKYRRQSLADLDAEIGKLPDDFPNYGDWPVTLPAGHWRAIRDLTARLAAAEGDKALLDALADESWDLRCFDIPTGGGDADIGWRVVDHRLAKPYERTVAEVYTDDPRAAIRAALAHKDTPEKEI